jgi:hypothetical protein
MTDERTLFQDPRALLECKLISRAFSLDIVPDCLHRAEPASGKSIDRALSGTGPDVEREAVLEFRIEHGNRTQPEQAVMCNRSRRGRAITWPVRADKVTLDLAPVAHVPSSRQGFPHRPLKPSPPDAMPHLRLLAQTFSQARHASKTAQISGPEPLCVDAPSNARGFLGWFGHAIRCGRVSALKNAA